MNRPPHGISLTLLRTLDDASLRAAREEIRRLTIPNDQQRFGGSPLELFDLEKEEHRHMFLIREGTATVGIGGLMTGPVSSTLWPVQKPAVQIRGFLIDASQQGRGLGTIAAKAAIELARTVDPAAEYVCLTVNAKNPGARRAYEKAGFSALEETYDGGPYGPQHIMYVSLSS